ncbi:hypothetical protein EYF80_041350 [Liparis tanakae]|uniref:Uncharacterized protein n=1 Tax=Liparis tanakae TaxID=230148 RepID=A0A4Z2G6M0_9TELE|nr:hypothetical protein EYF80_041350 [Liparis tanakae]
MPRWSLNVSFSFCHSVFSLSKHTDRELSSQRDRLSSRTPEGPSSPCWWLLTESCILSCSSAAVSRTLCCSLLLSSWNRAGRFIPEGRSSRSSRSPTWRRRTAYSFRESTASAPPGSGPSGRVEGRGTTPRLPGLLHASTGLSRGVT